MSDTPETDAHAPFRYGITTPDGVTTYYIPADFARKLERERDEAREAFVVATGQLVQSQEALREIAAADWKTSGELRGMARKALDGAK
jgi:hypothetical protein